MPLVDPSMRRPVARGGWLALLALLVAAPCATGQTARPAPEILRTGFSSAEVSRSASRASRLARSRTCGAPEVVTGELEGVRTALRRWAGT